jgi:hypothetical protein
LTGFVVKFNRQERTDRNWLLVNIDFFVTVALSPQSPDELSEKTASACTPGAGIVPPQRNHCPETGQLRRVKAIIPAKVVCPREIGEGFERTL